MQNNNIEAFFKRKYNILFLLVIIFRNLLSEAIQLNTGVVKVFCKFSFIIFSLLISCYLVIKILKSNFSKSQIIFLITLFLISLIGVIVKDTRIIFMCFITFIVFYMSINEIITGYFIMSVFMLIFTIVAPSLGFSGAIGKNTIGYFLFMVSFLLFFKIRKSKISFLLRVVLILVTVYLENIIHDRTAAYLFIIFAVCYFFKILQIKNFLVRFLIIILPLILTCFSIYLALNYGKYNWITESLNNFLSYRISIWNNLWHFYNINLFPQDIIQYAYGYSFIMNTIVVATDGFYAIGLLRYGLIIYTIYMIVMCGSIYKFYLLKDTNFEFLYSMIFFIIYGFSETLIDNGYLCFVIPLAFVYLVKNNEINNN